MDYQPKGGLSTNLMLTHDPIITRNHVMPETLMLEFEDPCYRQIGKFRLYARIHVYRFSFNEQLQKDHSSPPFIPFWYGSATIDPAYDCPPDSAKGIRFTTKREFNAINEQLQSEVLPPIVGVHIRILDGHNHHCGINQGPNFPEDPATKELFYLWSEFNKYGYCYSPVRHEQYMMRVMSFYRGAVV